MSVQATIVVSSAEAQARLEQLRADLAPGPARRELHDVLGRTGEGVLRRHFLGKNQSSPNRQGWRRQNFWSRIRSATAHDPARTTDEGAVVVIADPAIKAHVYGGTWGAKTSKYLAIPVHPDAYGVRPRSGIIPNLKFHPSLRGGNTAGWLYAETKKGERTYYYRLQKTVTVPRDATALPDAAALGARLVSAARSHLTRRTA